jgi:hypothetical protein
VKYIGWSGFAGKAEVVVTDGRTDGDYRPPINWRERDGRPQLLVHRFVPDFLLIEKKDLVDMLMTATPSI